MSAPSGPAESGPAESGAERATSRSAAAESRARDGSGRGRRVLVAPDKFRGTLDAPTAARAMAEGVLALGLEAVSRPLADGGEGLLDVVGGVERRERVTGPLGQPVVARWRFLPPAQVARPAAGGEGVRAGTSPRTTGGAKRWGAAGSGPVGVIEMAQAAGLALVGGAEHNDPVAATTTGVGELVLAAVAAGCRWIVVGCGGSATTDGGLGALRAIGAPARLGRARLTVAVDVQTPFLEAARVFGRQKGARPREVELLSRRLESLADRYRQDFGVDVTGIPGAAAAGGLAGGLAALGGEIVSGFDLVAELVGLADAVADANVVLTGEGHLDRASFDGKVVGGVVALARSYGRPVIAVVGDADDGAVPSELATSLEVCSLVGEFGSEPAWRQPAATLRQAVERVLARHLGRC